MNHYTTGLIGQQRVLSFNIWHGQNVLYTADICLNHVCATKAAKLDLSIERLQKYG